jgi:hypothetical protein
MSNYEEAFRKNGFGDLDVLADLNEKVNRISFVIFLKQCSGIIHQLHLNIV